MHKQETTQTENSKMEELQDIVDTSEHIVFLGGAGVSTESGIPDFRSKANTQNTSRNICSAQIVCITSRSCFLPIFARIWM